MHLRGQMPSAGESYHIWNRGANRQAILQCATDYERFLLLLYLYNTRHHVVMRDVLSKYSALRFKGQYFAEIFRHEYSDKSLVDILGYCVLPERFHLIVRPKCSTGMQIFMQKFCGAYSMYFNERYKHAGTLFEGRYKAELIENETQLRRSFASLYLGPLELVQADWKEKGIRNKRNARAFLSEYRYSSLLDHGQSPVRPQRDILAETLPQFLQGAISFDELLEWESRGRDPKARAL